MKTKAILIGSAVFLYAVFSIPNTKAEVSSLALILSEIQIDGKDNEGKVVGEDEFIELYNPTSQSIPLTGLKLCRKTSGTTTSQIKSFSASDTISKESYFIFANSEGKFGSFADVKTKSSPLAKNNSVALTNDCTSPTLIIDSVSWGSGKKFDEKATTTENPAPGHSLMRNLQNLSWSEADIPSPTSSSGTFPVPSSPITPEIPSAPPIAPPMPTPDPPAAPPLIQKPMEPVSVRLNEIFPNPKAKGDAGEFIELYNFGSEPADISGWTLRDATKTGKYIFPAGMIIAAAAYLAVTDQSFKLSLNNSNETVSLFDTTGTLIDSIRYEKTKDDVSLNYTAAGWRGGTPTPGAANLLNNLPETKEKVPKKGYHGVAIDFDARGKDTDGDTLKYVWDFGDGHKSYKEKTSHTYEENGTYIVTLKTTDGREDILETFTLKIQNLPHPEIRITSLMPNPAGSDTDNEWVILENRDKKTINLKGFSIATGWKNLVNHPVREDFLIEPKQERKLTRADSLFTLPNQKGKVELRAPDGKVLQALRYKLEKSAAENSVYSKAKGKRWEWHEEKPAEEKGEKESLAVSDTDENGAIPEEETPPEEAVPSIEESMEKQVLGAKTSHADDSEKFMPLLNYGTRVKIPNNISLAFDETDDISPLPPQEHYVISFAKESLSELNAALNELLHNAR